LKLDKAGQAALLKLSELDLEIARLKREISSLIESEELNQLTNKLTENSAELIEARTSFENLQQQVKRAEEDLRLVEARIVKDKERLNQTSSSKDAIGIQSELDGLLGRKESLEEIELDLLTQLEEAESKLSAVSTAREALNEGIASLQSKIQTRVDELKVLGRKASADREIVLSKVPDEILAKYNKLAARQVAVAQVIDRSCSACRMTLTVGAIDSLSSLAEDEIGTCPECQALIVR